MKLPKFDYPLMEILCHELQQRIGHHCVVKCFPNDLHRFYFLLQGQGLREALLFCFAHPFIRFHLIPISALPKDDSIHPLNSFLQEGQLLDARILQQDRILQLTFQTAQGERRFIGEFFSKHPNYYLLKPDGTVLFSLHKLAGTHYQLPPPHSLSSPPPIWTCHQEVERAYHQLEKEWQYTQEKEALLKELNQRLKKLQKKEKDLNQQLNDCNHWTALQHEGELIKSQFSSIKKGVSSFSFDDWLTGQRTVLTLDPLKTPQQEMALRFRKAKKLHDGILPLTQFLKRIHASIQKIEQEIQKIDQLRTVKELFDYKKSAPAPSPALGSIKASQETSSPIYREYHSASGLKIWVGRNAKANDRLTLQLANGRDWWLHIRGCPGSHVVIRLSKDQEPDPETLQDAMQLALHYSKARLQGEGEVLLTQRKYVSKMARGKAGQVQISKHQTVWVKFDPVRFQLLQARMRRS